MNLATPIEQLPRIGPQYQKKLERLGIKTIRDLIFHFPHRYEDFSNVIPIAQINPGDIVSVRGKIKEIKNIRTFRKRLTLTQALLEDDSGSVKVMWFNQPYLINTFKEGDSLFLAGKMNQGKNGRYLSSPSYEKVSDESQFEDNDLTHIGRLVPIYPETEGLSSRWLRYILKPLLTKLKTTLPDSLPEQLKEKYNFLNLEEAIWQIHFPESLDLAKKAKKRFTFEELFLLSLFVLKERLKLAQEKAVKIPFNLKLIQGFTKSLPFELTDDQRKASFQILKDLEKPRPMNRLLQGDVGSGKTVVAALAILDTVKAGYQTAFMAPTEILAKQHYLTLKNLFGKHKLKIGLVTSKENKLLNKKVTRKELTDKANKGEIDVLIGTHALIQKEVKFGNLALVIIDEQHRFGVDQRSQLCQDSNKDKKLIPHLLSMTATPIPRTLSLTLYGDLDLSLIKEIPKGRKKITTEIVAPEKRNQTYDFIREQIKQGLQVFVICPRIEVNESAPGNGTGRGAHWLDAKTVTEEYEKLSKKVFPELKIEMLHGRMKAKEKERIMKKFKEKKADILVSTSVIEVGIDIPNATVMMIEGSDKFGLAQLHQFRGRVGRGEAQSFCFLLTDTPSQTTNRRLRALMRYDSGFELAEKDLEIRGPGNFTGQRQWGFPDITMEALSDITLVSNTREEAKKILLEDSQFKKYPLLGDKLKEFQEKIHLE